jgi:biopolymer transport protein ExbB
MAEAAAFWIEAGGPVVLLLLALSLLSVALIAAKAVQLWPVRRGTAGREAALRAWAQGATGQALDLVAGGATPSDRVGAVAMRGLLARRAEPELRAEIERAGAAELDALGTHLRLLEIVAAVAPLIGLLGTVLGMIDAFRALELAQGAANAAVLAGGVWTALTTTAMGLIVAIPAAVAAGLFAARIDQVGQDMEAFAARLIAAEQARAA